MQCEYAWTSYPTATQASHELTSVTHGQPTERHRTSINERTNEAYIKGNNTQVIMTTKQDLEKYKSEEEIYQGRVKTNIGTEIRTS